MENYTRPCEDCGTPITGGPPTKRFCNVNCRMRTQKAKGRPRKDRQCGYCKGALTRNPKGDIGYCKSCSRLPKWRREGRPGPRQQRALKVLEEASRGRTGGNRVWTQGNCPWCGSEFMSPNAKFCSRQCRTNDRNRRKRPLRFRSSPVEREALRARDGDDCQLCMRQIDFTLPNPHIWSASVDHIEPQSHALVPDHSLSNLRLTHLLCNSMRRDELDMTADHIRAATERRWVELPVTIAA